MLVELSHVATHLASIGPDWLWHPLGLCTGTPDQITRCQSYNFWSGISGSFLANAITWPLAIAVYTRHHNCRVRRCRHMGHPHPVHGHVLCGDHKDVDPAELVAW